MAELQKPNRAGARSFSILTLLVAAVMAGSIVVLQSFSDNARNAEVRLMDIESMAYQTRSFDQEAEAEDQLDYSLVDNEASVNLRAKRTLAGLERLEHGPADLAEVADRFNIYHHYLVEKFSFLQQGNHPKAVSIGLVEVDPAFKELIDSVVIAQKQSESAAITAKLAASIGVILTQLVGAIVAAYLFRRAHQARYRLLLTEQETLKRSDLRYHGIFRNSAEVVMIVNADGLITYVSPATDRLWKRKASDVVGRRMLDFVPVEDVQRARALVAQALANPSQNIVSEILLQMNEDCISPHELILNNLLDDENIAGILATCRDITERKTFEEELTHQAFHDSLSGLPNRALFLDRLDRALAQAERTNKGVAVMFLDLDNFKVVNDSLGHEAGDHLLIAVADRVQKSVRRMDTIARLGGDEFTVLLEGITEPGDWIAIANRIAENLQAPIAIGSRTLIATASIGISVCTNEKIEAEAMLRDADTAMYQAKTNGKGSYVVFDNSMNERALERLDIEADLRIAIERQEFELYFQPIVQMDTGKIAEMEALIRWHHPERGLISPLKFIPVAEETGQIVAIGEWVLYEACRQAQQWRRDLPQYPPITIGVNLSARQVQDGGLIAMVRSTLAQTGWDPHLLKLEITESVMMTRVSEDMAKLNQLKDMGIRLAIDDFGTGYSSMAYLSNLPIDTLKIDRAFISKLGRNSEDDAIVQAIVTLAKSLNLKVTSEGIETDEQHQMLIDLGCDHGQGYLYSRPLAGGLILDLLKSTNVCPVCENPNEVRCLLKAA